MNARDTQQAELERIEEEYRRRDQGGGSGPAGWSDPAYVAYMQQIERGVLGGLAKAGADLRGARVLDVGCGSGYYLQRLVEYGAAEGHGIDLMQQRVDAARARYPGLDLRQGSATELPWEDGSFDVAAHFTCLSSVLDADVRRAIVQEMFRVTRPGGAVLSFDMRPTPWLWRAVRAAVSRGAGGGTPTEALDRAELRRLAGRDPDVLTAPTVHPEALAAARGSGLLRSALAAVPGLRSHYLAVWRV